MLTGKFIAEKRYDSSGVLLANCLKNPTTIYTTIAIIFKNSTLFHFPNPPKKSMFVK